MIIVRCLGVVSILIPGNIVTYIDCRPRIALREHTLKVNVTYVRLVCHVACVWFLRYQHYLRNKNKIRQKEAKKTKKRADERRQNISCCNLGLFLERLCWYVFLFLMFKKGFRFQLVAIIIPFKFFSSLWGLSPA